jgi:hypothetical protein
MSATGDVMPVVEISVVIGLITAWAVRKARRAGGRLDETADAAVDAVTDRLDAAVRSKLAGHPALRDLDEEAGTDPADDGESGRGDADAADSDGEVSDLTKEQLESSLRAAVTKDREFAEQLADLVAELQALTPQPGKPAGGVSMTAKASGHGRVYQAGRDQHIRER